jgi:hypothetical protein
MIRSSIFLILRFLIGDTPLTWLPPKAGEGKEANYIVAIGNNYAKNGKS